ncbi:alpha/beta fold hydrolase [Micromonospora parathelypteridis]|uniref:Pimeloyl-ACP methyl ester carboxylesterase n=1 Tax=Micromonospora parathelypteridis TaxID=1839617 RepID=A0A840VML5_9ACTN|nr:alpha/beta hydrolase [Micromonospora parathelypteridis]MBB5478202.1 pimeloyl-ACP methyl ester carboxylesterase [Micromonospora parathelypteridis]GGO07465.1 alpha/beta hydrolase [Micromonospora parathelypteridis]
MGSQTRYRSIVVDGRSVFYREAGAPDAPVLLLLHGFPSSSRMFETLLDRLADQFRLIAPDYPGFGHSDAPDPQSFPYTFDRIAGTMSNFAAAVGVEQYLLYVQDYGGPVGFRMALADPGRLRGLMVQNAVAHDAGLGPLWAVRRAFWQDRAGHEAAIRENVLSLAAIRARHVGNDPDPERYDPDLWVDEHAFLSRPGVIEQQLDLQYDYRTNVASYPAWQDWLRRTQPPLLVVWGRHDTSFEITEPEAYRSDVPGAEVHLLDGGHFVLDTRPDEVAALVRAFAGRILEAGRWGHNVSRES